MNFQNIPRDDKVVKRAFVPKRGAFSEFDYKAIEPRLAAYFTAKIGYPSFAQQIAAGTDPYTAVAKLVTGKEEISAEERQTWKVMFLSLLYGGGRNTIMLQFGVGQREAGKMINTFHNGWPAVRELSDRVQATAHRRGYIVGIDGRHLHPEEFGEHKLLNKLIQGSAAGIMKRALLNIGRFLNVNDMQSRPIATVHDSVLWDGPLDEVEELHRYVPFLMRQGFEHVHEIVPILVDHEVSTTNWAEKISYEEWRSTERQPEQGRGTARVQGTAAHGRQRRVPDQGQRPAAVV